MVICKICGLTRAQDVVAAIEAGADWLGFVFAPSSPRALDILKGKELRQIADGRAKVVALTVDAPLETLDVIVAEVRPDLLQFHGEESPALLSVVKQRYHLPLIKAIAIRSQADLLRAETYRECADYLLLDAAPPKGAAATGGHGVAFDWTLLKEWQAPLPWLLAGGLTPHMIAAAKRATNATGFDVSSGVESAKGIKDASLMTAFVAECHLEI